ncbi:adenine-specific methyltransferase EcoRI family protein [Draconibacterium orientale]|uniref:adenine-specific methyltransferase EcoRI family protein n=1 Tax=Draconibacterium orientale TaxID=1168034 RepID=UPI0029C0D0D1|nr:adenine-specific methyltransferase EcoRI family protein [Draconibacterium orientale]
MAKKSTTNTNFESARKGKNDEFYTILTDIEKELKHYKKQFRDKVVYCNCDDPRISNFFLYFSYNFEKLGLKKLITTCFKNQDRDLFSRHDSEKAIYLEYNGDLNHNNIPDPEEIGIKELKGDGDFRSRESIELLKQADIVVTNPPFSLFREYVAQLLEYDKKFLIIGNGNSITYKEIFKNIQDNKLWLGVTKPQHFLIDNKEKFAKYCSDDNKVMVGDKEYWEINISVGTPTYWFTNLDVSKRHEDIILYKSYTPEEYPKYDNYDAIEVGKVTEIPMDYKGAMGVPITFLTKYNPDQFEILGITDRENESGLKTKVYTKEDAPNPGDLNRRAALKIGDTYKSTYARLLIKHKRL